MITHETIIKAANELDNTFSTSVKPKLEIIHSMWVLLKSLYQDPRVKYVENTRRFSYEKPSFTKLMAHLGLTTALNNNQSEELYKTVPLGIVSLYGYSTTAFATLSELVMSFAMENRVKWLIEAKKYIDCIVADIDSIIALHKKFESWVNCFRKTLYEDEMEIDAEFMSIFGNKTAISPKIVKITIEYL